MPLYEYYCQHCHGIFERSARCATPRCRRPARSAAARRRASCPAFTAFTMRDGYPRRIPDKGTYWHMGKEVKKRAKRMKGHTHPELAEPKPAPRPAKGESTASGSRQLAQRVGRALPRQVGRQRARHPHRQGEEGQAGAEDAVISHRVVGSLMLRRPCTTRRWYV